MLLLTSDPLSNSNILCLNNNNTVLRIAIFSQSGSEDMNICLKIILD